MSEFSASDLLSAVAPEKEAKNPAKKYVTFSKEEWSKVEKYFGRRVEAPEVKALILALGTKVDIQLMG